MASRNTPLPPQLTGVPLPANFDPAQMPWKTLEVSPTDLGVIRLGGKDVDLYRLWILVTNAGGGPAVRKHCFVLSGRAVQRPCHRSFAETQMRGI